MNVVTVTITRLGNKYLREFIEYYKNLGVDKMFFYDNNHEDEENIMDVVSDYVESGFVEVVNFRNERGRLQEMAYQDFYEKHGNDYDWYGIFDDDEYVVLLDGSTNIKEFVSKDIFADKNGIAFPMINFCDTNVIVNNKNTRLDVYTDVMDPNNLYHNSFYKTMVRGGLNIQYKDAMVNGEKYNEGCHIPFIDGIVGNGIVDCDGNDVRHDKFSFITQYATKNAFLKHIPTGSIDDYINMKRRRGWPDTNSDMNNKFDINYFSRYNHLTQEKIDYYNNKVKNLA